MTYYRMMQGIGGGDQWLILTNSSELIFVRFLMNWSDLMTPNLIQPLFPIFATILSNDSSHILDYVHRTLLVNDISHIKII